MLYAIYFALHFAMIMLGAIITIHFDVWIGLLIMGTFAVKFAFMLPNNNEQYRQEQLTKSFERNKNNG